MSDELEVTQKVDLIVKGRNRSMLLLYLGGKTKEDLAVKYSVGLDYVDQYIHSALEDLRDADLQIGVQSEIVNRLIADIQSLEEWERDLQPSFKKATETIITVAKDKQETIELLSDCDSDKMVKIKLIGEKRALYNLLLQVVRLQPEAAKGQSEREKVNDEILSALVNVAKDAGRNEERADRTRTYDVPGRVIDVE
jgi:hypothetical protein